MSVKDVREYYDKVCSDYADMLSEVHDFEELASKNIVTPEQLQQFTDIMTALKTNYERISFIMFLLNKPVRKNSVPGYMKRNQKFLESANVENSTDAQLDENKKVLEKLEEFTS